MKWILAVLSRRPVCLQATLLMLLVSAAYYPSLFVPARADQFVYLNTTKDKADFCSLAVGCYSWNRDLQADAHLFRPILFFLLGVEQWAFSATHFFAWQLTNLLLHLAVVGLLFRYFLSWDRATGWPAFATAAFFGVQYASMELVAWHHLGGYLLFCVFLMGVFCLLAPSRHKQSPPHPQPLSPEAGTRGARGKQAGVVGLLLLGAFTMEFGNVLAALVAGYMLLTTLCERRAAPGTTARTFHGLTIFAAGCVPVLYTTANLADQWARYGRLYAGPTAEGCLGVLEGCSGMAHAAGLWLQSGLLPGKIDLGVDSRMGIVHVRPIAALAVQGALAGLAVLAFGLLAAQSLRQGRFRPPALACVGLLFALLYTAVLVFLRAGPRGLEAGLASNSYYAYIFNLTILVSLFPLIRDLSLGLPSPGATERGARMALGGALAAIALFSAFRVHAQGKAEARWGRPVVVLVEQVRKLHAAAGDKDFTFCVAAEHPGEWELPFVGKGLDGRPPTVAAILFPRAYSRQAPRYIVWKRYRGFDVVSCGNRVFAIPCKAWPRDLDRLESPCITARSLVEIMRRIDRR